MSSSVVPPLTSTACRTFVALVATLNGRLNVPSVVPWLKVLIVVGVTPSNQTSMGEAEFGSEIVPVKVVAYVGGKSLLDRVAD